MSLPPLLDRHGIGEVPARATHFRRGNDGADGPGSLFDEEPLHLGPAVFAVAVQSRQNGQGCDSPGEWAWPESAVISHLDRLEAAHLEGGFPGKPRTINPENA